MDKRAVVSAYPLPCGPSGKSSAILKWDDIAGYMCNSRRGSFDETSDDYQTPVNERLLWSFFKTIDVGNKNVGFSAEALPLMIA
jgi:hypothetical protein